MSILTHDEAKRLSQSSTDPLEVIRNVEAAMIAKLCAEVERLKEVVNLQVENYAELKEQNEAQHGYFNSVMQERDALQAEAKHLNLHLKATQSGRDAALARLAEIEADASTQPKMVTPYITQEHFDKTFPVNVPPSQAQPPAPGEAAREYMTGYSDGREWAGATNQAQPPAPDCRTCEFSDIMYDGEQCNNCTNGDEYQPAPKVVLWRK